MKKYFFIPIVALSISLTGCINTSCHNDSQDDIWIQERLDKGELLPDILKQ